MAQKTFNNIEVSSTPDLVVFDDVYNLMSISETITGSKESYILSFNNTTAAPDNEYYITFLGNSISNVSDPKNAKGNFFYCKPSDNSATAMSVCRALRNCPNINASFSIYVELSVVTLEARNIGSLDEILQTNMPSNKLSIAHNAGSTSSTLQDSTVVLDIFDDTTNLNVALEKTFFNDEVAFDVSPVLTTFAEYEAFKHFTLVMSHITNDGSVVEDGYVESYVAKGYKTSYSDKYLDMYSTLLLPHPEDYVFWSYASKIEVAYLLPPTSRTSISFYTYASDGTLLHNQSDTLTGTDKPTYGKYTYTIPGQHYNAAHRVKVEYANDEVWFDLIKPLKMTDENTRIKWYNEWSGISFFDFTGEHSNNITMSKKYNYKNIYDYYSNPDYEEEKVYSTENQTEYTVASHLVDKDSLFICESLSLAKDVWIENEDGSKTYIIISGVTKNKDNNSVDQYTIQVKYHKSYEQAK